MAGTRRAGDDRSNMNKIYKPIAGYFGNAAKEVGEFGSAWKKAFNASADVRPGANARARAANANQDAQMGQALGAILQGRRYTDSGKQITKGTIDKAKLKEQLSKGGNLDKIAKERAKAKKK
jgi:hypothetical protein